MPAEASATADIFENADGSITRKVYPAPVNFKAADGSWQPIDTSLRRNADGRWQIAASEIKLLLAGQRAGEWGRGAAAEQSQSTPATELVSLTFAPGKTFGYGLVGAASVDPAVSGSKATYVNILPGTDVELTALDSGVKETILLKSRDAATEWYSRSI